MTRARTSAAASALALSALCACSNPLSASPVLSALEPSSTPAGTETAMVIRGSGFAVQLQVDFDAPAASRVQSQFTLTLVSGNARVPLTSVQLVSDSQLSATLPAGAASPGTYDLELVDPQGRTLRLASALRAYAVTCAHDGDPCDDGDPCTQGETCQAGACVSPPPSCVPSTDTPPIACFTFTSDDSQSSSLFTFDATCASDAEDDQAGKPLQIRWYFDGSSGSPSAFSTTPIVTHLFDTPGVHQVLVEVLDSGGLSTFSSQPVLVSASSDVVWVTTAQDENDGDVTPASPGGTGLSLREAIRHVNKLGAPRTIQFRPRVTAISILGDSGHGALDALTIAGSAIVGRPDLTLDFGGMNSGCFTLSAANQLLLGLRMSGCAGTGVLMDGGSAGSQVANCTITGSASACGIKGSAGGTIGPGNLLSGLSTGVQVTGNGYTIDGNRIHDNGGGIQLSNALATVQRNVVYKNDAYGLQAANVGSQVPTKLYFNVFDSNRTIGVTGGQTLLVAQNNLFTRNGQHGVSGGYFSIADHNGFFDNPEGSVPNYGVSPSDVSSDPQYIDASSGDYRLAPASPMVDKGIDVGLDVNGPAPGDYDGAAPDIGAFEMPYGRSSP